MQFRVLEAIPELSLLPGDAVEFDPDTRLGHVVRVLHSPAVNSLLRAHLHQIRPLVPGAGTDPKGRGVLRLEHPSQDQQSAG